MSLEFPNSQPLLDHLKVRQFARTRQTVRHHDAHFERTADERPNLPAVQGSQAQSGS